MPPSGSKNMSHGVQRRDNRNKVLPSYNKVLAGKPSIAHGTVSPSAAPVKGQKKPDQCLSYPYVAKIRLLRGVG